MAHDHLKTSVETQTGKATLRLIATMMGGILVVLSFVAEYFFEAKEIPDMFALVGAVCLGAPLIMHALQEMMAGHSHMDELVALAVAAAIALGEYQEAGVIAFFMIISTLIETRTAIGARASIESLIRLTPDKAQLLANGQETEIEAKSLKPGDVIRVRPGDNIAADGVVISGESTVNEANITGESLPVDKSISDEVFNGTSNMTGALDIRVTKAGEETTLGQVQHLILDAERTRLPMMRMIDRYAAWYTPTIIMLAGIVMFSNLKDGGAQRAIAMLVVACPCALVLATPTAMVAALSCAARLGILVKNVVTLEGARNLTAVVFDKTGTLTTGELSVTQMKPAPGIEGTDLLRFAASADAMSKHPNARALVSVARKAKLHLTDPGQFEEVAGKGVSAQIDGDHILVGRNTFLTERGVDMSLTQNPEFAEPQGMSILYVSRSNQLIGWIGLEDRTRDEARAAIDDLRELGIRELTMVTGDKRSVAERVAKEMGCTDVYAEVLPARKLELVDELKAAGHRVAVIGDGVNDAPALAAGDISVAMGAAGSDVAINSASIALMNNDLGRLPFLIKLSRAATKVVWQNILFGVFYIVVLMVLTAMGEVTAMMAAFLHMIAGAIVIFNSARLVRFGEHLDATPARLSVRQASADQSSAVQAEPVPA